MGVDMQTGRIQPPFMLYTLHAEPGTRNSPAEPAVHLVEAQSLNGDSIRVHTLTPEQARDLATQLLDAARAAQVALPAVTS